MTDILKKRAFLSTSFSFYHLQRLRGSWQDQLEGCSREALGGAMKGLILYGHIPTLSLVAKNSIIRAIHCHFSQL